MNWVGLSLRMWRVKTLDSQASTTSISTMYRDVMNDESPRQIESLSRKTAFQLLSHSYRLALLDCLEAYDETLTLADASEQVASKIEDAPVEEIEAESVKRIYLSLYHSHVPRLEAHDIVQYDQEQDLVTLDSRADQLVAYMNQSTNRPADQRGW